MNKMSWKVW